MTPNGQIYVSGIYVSDYSATTTNLKSFFIHEMVHVYQHQMKILSPISAAIVETLRHGFDYDKAYFYSLDTSKDLLNYEIEQQAQIIEDYYRINILGVNPVTKLGKEYMENTLAEVKTNTLFAVVLKKFTANPTYAKHEISCKVKRSGKTRRNICKRVLAK